MSLQDYHKKRKFDATPEPEGIEKISNGPLTFVIQRHEASRLHYDFRLELSGVLKSWAVPKGPSMNPDDKRLAVMVEDHPLDYAQFEGIIPKGNYGAGTVMVWDRGVYSPIAFVAREQAEVVLSDQLKKGHLTFVLLGEKLKGEFALVKTRGADEDAWLLIKAGDEYANKRDILKKDTSVLSGRSMKQIEKQAVKKQEVWFSKPTKLNITGIPKGEMPHKIKPMLAQTSDEPFDDKDWVFEMKYDGYRVIAEKESSSVMLHSRNGISYNDKFAPIAISLVRFPGDVVLDGEVVIVDSDGKPHFQWLQEYPDTKQGELVYFVFDMLHYDGYDLTGLPLYRRKELLKEVLPPLSHIKFADHIGETGITMFRHIQKLGLEGIMAKHSQSTYVPGTRSTDWLKIKTLNRQEVVIAGFTRPKGSRKHFGALIMGLYKHGKLTYIGHVGGGFDDELLESIYEQLQPLVQDECPFATTPQTNAPATWLRPELLAEITFSNWTKDGQVRHPIFLGLREDKDAREVTQHSSVIPANAGIQGKNKIDSRFHGNDKFSVDSSKIEVQIGRQELTLTNLSKVFWPEEKYTKGEVVEYYQDIASVILPYLKDRPESLLRYPNGITGESFYQKDAGRLDVEWIEKVMIHSGSNDKDIPYLLCQNEAALVYLINLGCIDLNPWSSRVGSLEHPDYLIIDLDPEVTTFEHVVKTALATRDVLEKFAIPSYPKTSGAKGMHVYVPLGAQYTYEQSRNLAELLCIYIHNKIPEITSLQRNPKDRQGLVYLDYLQNIKGQTLASVYSVRAQPGATVSTPLEWKEVTMKLHPSQFTMKNMMKRIQSKGDLFKGVLGKGINMEKVLEKMRESL